MLVGGHSMRATEKEVTLPSQSWHSLSSWFEDDEDHHAITISCGIFRCAIWMRCRLVPHMLDFLWPHSTACASDVLRTLTWGNLCDSSILAPKDIFEKFQQTCES
mmetsp:Transcript_95322/g.179204  ORF Transcript_95322/g.179204 Transcript_95322/m.179204 type:complete len:105 (+) Transcript_95322:342-656(+)